MKLQFLQHADLSNIVDTLISLSVAFVLGALIGFERQYRQRTAGLRTNVLVAVGAAILWMLQQILLEQMALFGSLLMLFQGLVSWAQV